MAEPQSNNHSSDQNGVCKPSQQRLGIWGKFVSREGRGATDEYHFIARYVEQDQTGGFFAEQ